VFYDPTVMLICFCFDVKGEILIGLVAFNHDTKNMSSYVLLLCRCDMLSLLCFTHVLCRVICCCYIVVMSLLYCIHVESVLLLCCCGLFSNIPLKSKNIGNTYM
jgi:hypothetical protein